MTTSKSDSFHIDISPQEYLALAYDWTFWARESQLAPAGDWQIWLILAGRGWGKTRTGAEWIRSQVENEKATRIALVGETAADIRDVMIEGDSGLLAIAPPWFRPRYEPSKRRLTWPNGAYATTYSADDPEQLRGPQHDCAWADEIAKWRHAESWDQLMLGLRLGNHPRCVATTTPKPKSWLRNLMNRPSVVTTHGHSFDNAENLSPLFLTQMKQIYEGTQLGQQELAATFLDENPHGLWHRAMIEAARIPATTS